MLARDGFWLVTGLVAGALVGLVLARDADGPWHRRLALALAGAHIGAVLAVTLFPLPIASMAPLDPPPSDGLQLEPFATIRLLFAGTQSVRQLGGNLLLLAPMGVLVPLAWRAARPFSATVLVGLLTSLVIELLQYAIGMLAGEFYRVVDVDDVLLNTAGVIVGRFVFALVDVPFRWVRRRWRARRARDRR